MEEALDLLKSINIDKTKPLVVATSGGPDSMALLHLLKTNNFNCICAHVNHNLREVSKEEYIFVENYCNDNDIIFEGMEIASYKNNKFTEQEARKKRYAFFEKILKKYNTDILLTAHHGDDLIETILMRIIRGSNLNGFKGFTKISNYNNFKIIRPLIFYTKKDIEKYIEINNIPYVIDETNKLKKYTRNRIRLDILPLLKNENKNIHKKFLELSDELNDINKYVKKVINIEIQNNYKNNILNLKMFNKLDDYIKRKELETLLFNIYKEKITLINKKHIENILTMIKTNKNSELYLPNNIKVDISYNTLTFKKQSNETIEKYKYILKDEIYIENYGYIKHIPDTKEKSNYVIKLNSKEIKLPLIIRTRLEKDNMIVKNMEGRKKISKIMIDEKIPKDKRDSYPIVTDSDNNILWIPGVKKSKFDCYNKRNYDIIIKYTKKENNDEEK